MKNIRVGIWNSFEIFYFYFFIIINKIINLNKLFNCYVCYKLKFKKLKILFIYTNPT